MKIYIGADHRGFELKNKLVGWLKEREYDVQDCGNTEYDPADDYPDYVSRVCKRVQNASEDIKGIVICGSGVGVDIAANKHLGIRSGLGFDPDQVRSACADDDINVLALAVDYLSQDQAQKIVEVFLNTPVDTSKRHKRRREKVAQTEKMELRGES